jgi:hypothetical protein
MPGDDESFERQRVAVRLLREGRVEAALRDVEQETPWRRSVRLMSQERADDRGPVISGALKALSSASGGGAG